MSTRTIRINEEVYEKLEARKREDESFSDVVARLVGDPSMLELAGVLSEEEAEEVEAAIEDFRGSLDEEFDEVAEEVS